jgi:hypothetical protein
MADMPVVAVLSGGMSEIGRNVAPWFLALFGSDILLKRVASD